MKKTMTKKKVVVKKPLDKNFKKVAKSVDLEKENKAKV